MVCQGLQVSMRFKRGADDQDGDMDGAGNAAHQQSMTGRKIMHIKSIVAGAGVVLLATLGAAQAGDSFDTLHGVATYEMSQAELSRTQGGGIIVVEIPAGITVGITNTNIDFSLTGGNLTVEAFKPAEFKPVVDVLVGFGPR